jgi:hypothetical protein
MHRKKPDKSRSKQHYCSLHQAACPRQQDTDDLKMIMNSIRHLQERVYQLPQTLRKKQPLKGVPGTPKGPSRSNRSQSKKTPSKPKDPRESSVTIK